MKICVQQELCCGGTLCETFSSLFVYEGSGQSGLVHFQQGGRTLSDGIAEVPVGDEEDVAKAVKYCPTGALKIVDS